MNAVRAIDRAGGAIGAAGRARGGKLEIALAAEGKLACTPLRR